MKLPKALRAFLLNPPDSRGLVFDLEGMENNAQAAKSSLENQTLLMAVKSFPHPKALGAILPHLDGIDVSNLNEFALAKDFLKEGSEVWFTRSPIQDFKQILPAYSKKFKLWFTVENVLDLNQLMDLKKKYEFKISLRFNSSSLLGKDSTYTSRFGLDLKEASSFLKDVQGLHLHHGSESNNSETFRLLASQVSSVVKDTPIEKVNMGGGWNLQDEKLVAEIKKQKFSVVVEPGRFFSEEFGYAFGKINSIKKKNDVLSLDGDFSVTAGARWARNLKMAVFPSGNTSVIHQGQVVYNGPTCYEGDSLLINDVNEDWKIAIEDYVIFHPIPGYSFAWNKDFNGIETKIYFLSGVRDE